MHKNAVWIGFLLIVVVIALWFVVKASYGVIAYTRLSTQVEIEVHKWSVEQKKTDQFAVLAHYSFEYEDKEYVGAMTTGSFYPNPWAANRAIEKFSEQRWSVWINPKHPNKAVFQKKFPYKSAFSAVILLGLSIYFFILGTYMGGKNG